tara:strand:+ start:2708 stop:3040 length:333 start_codon:yes stop_codon:yes gene_type:complete
VESLLEIAKKDSKTKVIKNISSGEINIIRNETALRFLLIKENLANIKNNIHAMIAHTIAVTLSVMYSTTLHKKMVEKFKILVCLIFLAAKVIIIAIKAILAREFGLFVIP